MDPFRLAIAFGPLALYLLALGLLNLRRRPAVVSGARDSTALALALAGLVMIGPVELFLPRSVAAHYGPKAWALVGGMYALVVSLWIMTQRPRITIYNAPPALVAEVLRAIMPRLDPSATLVGQTANLPARDVDFQIDSLPPLRNTTLVALADHQSLAAWRQLETHLAAALAERTVAPNLAGGALFAVGVVLLAMIGSRWAGDPVAVTESMRQMLRLPDTAARRPRSERPVPPAAQPASSDFGASRNTTR